MRSSIAASVVDLPEPVGPVTSTSALVAVGEVARHHRQAEILEAQDVEGDGRMAIEMTPRCRKTLAPEPRTAP